MELQQLFKRGRILPVTDAEIVAEKELREEALAELEVSIPSIRYRLIVEIPQKSTESDYNILDRKHVSG